MRIALGVAAMMAGLALAGCQSTQSPSVVATKASFDNREAAFIKKRGEGKIAGHAFWRTTDGGTQNASGEIIRLVPVTAYSRERFSALYAGRRSVPAGSIPKVDADPAYADYTRTTRAESSGRFEFGDVAPGDYYVTAQVVWKDKKAFVSQGGAMFDVVTVTGKEDGPIKLVLTNDR